MGEFGFDDYGNAINAAGAMDAINGLQPIAPGSTLLQGLPGISQSIPSFGGAAGAGAGGAMGALNSVMGFLGPIGAIAGTVGTIANMFKRSPQGNAKMDATRSQENMQKWMQDIEKQVNAGSLDPDTAIAMIRDISNQAIGSDQYGANAAGQAQVNAMANQIIGNISQKRNWNLQAGLGSNDRIMSGNTPGSPGFQKERGQTLMRNLALGTGLGKEFQASGAPLGQAFQRSPLDSSNFGKSLQDVNKSFQGLFPTPANPNLGSTLKSKLAFYGK